MHGAAEIMQAKNALLNNDEDQDIEKLIEEGEKQAKKIQEEANQQAEKMKDFFDFSMQQIDCFAF